MATPVATPEATATTDSETIVFELVEPEAGEGWSLTDKFAEIFQAFQQGATRLFTLMEEEEGLTNFVGRHMGLLRRETINADGKPNWKGDAAVYKANVNGFVAKLVASRMPYPEGADQKQRQAIDKQRKSKSDKLINNGRQFLNRGRGLEEVITEYVRDTTPNLDWSKCRWDGPSVGHDENPNAAAVVLQAPVPAKVKDAMHKVYLDIYGPNGVPVKFGGPKGAPEATSDGTGGGDRKAESKLNGITAASDVLNDEDTKIGVEFGDMFYRLTSSVVSKYLGSSEIAGGVEEFGKILTTCASLLNDAVKAKGGHYRAGENHEKVMARIEASLWKAPQA